ncbi:hypothetical protein B0H13DRAFT_513767 [Mycena leptocephala]|nr:hypothetical protein B0H13DRAFT_513767 [Mycena leptocephala]
MFVGQDLIRPLHQGFKSMAVVPARELVWSPDLRPYRTAICIRVTRFADNANHPSTAPGKTSEYDEVAPSPPVVFAQSWRCTAGVEDSEVTPYQAPTRAEMDIRPHRAHTRFFTLALAHTIHPSFPASTKTCSFASRCENTRNFPHAPPHSREHSRGSERAVSVTEGSLDLAVPRVFDAQDRGGTDSSRPCPRYSRAFFVRRRRLRSDSASACSASGRGVSFALIHLHLIFKEVTPASGILQVLLRHHSFDFEGLSGSVRGSEAGR